MSNVSQALQTPQRWLICGGVALCMLSLSILHSLGIIFRCKVRAKYRLGAAATLIFIVIVGSGLQPIAIIGLVAFLCATQEPKICIKAVNYLHPKIDITRQLFAANDRSLISDTSIDYSYYK